MAPKKKKQPGSDSNLSTSLPELTSPESATPPVPAVSHAPVVPPTAEAYAAARAARVREMLGGDPAGAFDYHVPVQVIPVATPVETAPLAAVEVEPAPKRKRGLGYFDAARSRGWGLTTIIWLAVLGTLVGGGVLVFTRVMPSLQGLGSDPTQIYASNYPIVTGHPTPTPTASPTPAPTAVPTATAPAQPVTTPAPTKKPTTAPTRTPTAKPTNTPTPKPTGPTPTPTATPPPTPTPAPVTAAWISVTKGPPPTFSIQTVPNAVCTLTRTRQGGGSRSQAMPPADSSGVATYTWGGTWSNGSTYTITGTCTLNGQTSPQLPTQTLTYP